MICVEYLIIKALVIEHLNSILFINLCGQTARTYPTQAEP